MALPKAEGEAVPEAAGPDGFRSGGGATPTSALAAHYGPQSPWSQRAGASSGRGLDLRLLHDDAEDDSDAYDDMQDGDAEVVEDTVGT